jgi:cysteine desulfurase
MYMKIFSKKQKIYFDYAGASPVDPSVALRTRLIENKYWGNPNAIHASGVNARDIIEKSRISLARNLNAHSDEIFFTGSATESIACAILGIVENFHKNKKDEKEIPHIVTTNIEHSAVLENCRLLEEKGLASVTYVECDKDGIVNPKEIRKAINKNTILVSVMYANNEIGTIQPIQEIAKEIRHFRKNNENSIFPFFHTDACQAMNYLFVENIEKLGVDMMSFNSSKIYGPKGIGCLYKKRSVVLEPIYRGGGQEGGLRSGTENVVSIVGLSEALNKTLLLKEKEVQRLSVLRDYFFEKIKKLKQDSGYGIVINGDEKNRLPNNINISILGISSELVVIELDAKGIEVSERSACASNEEGVSHVLVALRCAQEEKVDEVSGSIRISLGRQSTKKEIDFCIKTLENILKKYKNLR